MTTRWRRAAGSVSALFAVAAVLACDTEQPYIAKCVAVDLTCEPSHEPTFDVIFENILAPRCGLPGNGCHSTEGAQDGLVLDEVDRAYDTLMGLEGDRSRVIPGDPSCSLVVTRLASISPTLVMPPGEPLPDAERCAIDRWILDGALR
jgi:hypothetical protein